MVRAPYQVSTVLCSDPTSLPPFASLASSTCRAYSSLRTRAAGISRVALLTSCVTRMGLRPRVSVSRSPGRGCRCCLPVCTNLGQDPRVTKFRGSIPCTAGQPVQSIHPRYLSVYASTRLLPDALQHSIPGLWLAVTRAIFSTRLSTDHFQSARASFCSWAVGCGGCAAGRPSASRRSVILPRRRDGGKLFFASRGPQSHPGQPSPGRLGSARGAARFGPLRRIRPEGAGQSMHRSVSPLQGFGTYSPPPPGAALHSAPG
jgi:hypothetical protein